MLASLYLVFFIPRRQAHPLVTQVRKCSDEGIGYDAVSHGRGIGREFSCRGTTDRLETRTPINFQGVGLSTSLSSIAEDTVCVLTDSPWIYRL